MTVKRLLQLISFAGLAVAIWAVFSWAFLLSETGEDYDSFTSKVDTLWTIIPVGLVVSVVAGIASTRIEPRSERSGGLGKVLAIVAILVAAGIVWMLLNLGIS